MAHRVAGAVEQLAETLFKMAQKRLESRAEPRESQFARYLVKYRVAAGISQGELARGLRPPKRQSYIGMLESGRRPPPYNQVLGEMIRILGLATKPHDAQVLRLAARGALDLLDPSFIPLDPAALALEVVNYQNMVWVVGRKPIEFDAGKQNDLYRVVLNNISVGKTRYVYWIPESKILQFDALKLRLKSDLERKLKVQAKRLPESLRCIKTPEILCVFQFAIYNPFDPSSRLGHLGFQNDADEVVEFVRMSRACTKNLFEILQPAYEALINEKEYALGQASFENSMKFIRHYPP